MTAIIHGEFQPENLNQKSADTVPLPSIRGGSRGEQAEDKWCPAAWAASNFR